MSRRKHISFIATVGVLASLVSIGVELDKWRLERAQIIAQSEYDRAVLQCGIHGGRWWRGACMMDLAGRP